MSLKTKLKRWGWLPWIILLTLAAGWGAWAWHTLRSGTLRLECTVEVSGPTMDYAWPWFGIPGGIYLRKEQTRIDGPVVYTLIGWDGKPCWTITSPVNAMPYPGATHSFNGEPTLADGFALVTPSPDGQVFALAAVDGKIITVTSWRNGHLLGQARVPWSPKPEHTGWALRALDSGRCWLYQAYMPEGSCRLWAIDGARVASGRYTASTAPGLADVYCAISPSGARLWGHCSRSLDYVTLTVQGTRVRVERDYTVQTDGDKFSWLDDEHIDICHSRINELTPDITLLGPHGILEYGNLNECRIYAPALNRSSVIPGSFNYAATYTPDHRALVFWEEMPGSRLKALMRRIPLLGSLNEVKEWRLSIYTKSDRPTAIGFLSGNIFELALSPDGRRVAVLAYDDHGRRCVRVYGPGKGKK
ncbi:MAG: hypothetical protein ACYC7E_09180 [Armatimonadota bacterium]